MRPVLGCTASGVPAAADVCTDAGSGRVLLLLPAMCTMIVVKLAIVNKAYRVGWATARYHWLRLILALAFFWPWVPV
jgi:hypothetical protein